MLKPNQISGQLKCLDMLHSDAARAIGVDRSTVTHTIQRSRKSRRVRAGIAAILGMSYEYVWGEPDPEADEEREGVTPPDAVESDLGGAARTGAGDEPVLARAASF